MTNDAKSIALIAGLRVSFVQVRIGRTGSTILRQVEATVVEVSANGATVRQGHERKAWVPTTALGTPDLARDFRTFIRHGIYSAPHRVALKLRRLLKLIKQDAVLPEVIVGLRFGNPRAQRKAGTKTTVRSGKRGPHAT